jgi:predicted TIM-barrel fold metal-dependent hydrolase
VTVRLVRDSAAALGWEQARRPPLAPGDVAEEMNMDTRSRYVVISADGHAGADIVGYRPYLEQRYLEQFDRWSDAYVNPFGDLERPDANRNWDSDVRNAALEADGIVGEVVYPNTIPPFFPIGGLIALAPSASEYELRLAGLRAHNRWLADWCAQLPGRRAGVGQLLLNHVDDAVDDVHWIADHGLFGGVLLPGIPPGSGIDPLHSPAYDPVWRACEERGVVLNVHGGSGSPDQGWFPATLALFVLEASFYSHRPLWGLVMSGVFDRFPGLKLVFAEAGSSWIPTTLSAMDNVQAKQDTGNIGVLTITHPFRLQKKPSEYWRSNCWIGASFMTRGDAEERDAIGVDRIMWGSDFPHEEGTFPHSREALAHTFAGVDVVEVEQMLGGSAAGVYGFDLDAIRPVADRIGPEVAAVAAGIDAVPEHTTSFAFGPRSYGAS